MSTVKVWVYEDPASGVELHMEPGIGDEMEISMGMLAEFNAAQARLESISEAIIEQRDEQRFNRGR